MSILVTGGTGNFAGEIAKVTTHIDFIFLDRIDVDISTVGGLTDYIKNMTELPTAVLHLAALTHPMELHEENSRSSILNNIIGTSNVAIACASFGIKMIYASTDWVYKGYWGEYSEDDPTIPTTNYGWSKLGGECATRMVWDHLILRMAMVRKPFPHPKAFTDVRKSSVYVDQAAEMTVRSIESNLTGVYNIGSKEPLSVYDFARKENPDIGQCKSTDVSGITIPRDATLNCSAIAKDLLEYDTIISHTRS